MTLSVWYADTPRARRGDPATSHAAAANSERFATSHIGRIVAALKAHGPMSPAQMQAHTGLSVVQIDRRRIEAINAGLIRVRTVGGIPQTYAGCEVLEVISD